MKKIIAIIILVLIATGSTFKVEALTASASTNVNINATVPGCLLLITAKPEKRVPPINNWGTILQLEMFKQDNTLLYSATPTTDNFGKAQIDVCSQLTETGAPFNFCIRGYSHLSKYYTNIPAFYSYGSYIDFSSNNQFLLAGEISKVYDDYINALDLSVMINNLYTADYKSDLNQDGLVNALDLSNLITNFYISGDNCLK